MKLVYDNEQLIPMEDLAQLVIYSDVLNIPNAMRIRILLFRAVPIFTQRILLCLNTLLPIGYKIHTFRRNKRAINREKFNQDEAKLSRRF